MSRVKSKHERIISSLLTSPSVKAAAENCGFSERHLWRLLKQDDFRARYRKARNQVAELAATKIQAIMLEAVETLKSVMLDRDTKASVRVTAAKVLLEQGLRSWEMADIETRMSDLEKAIQSQRGNQK